MTAGSGAQVPKCQSDRRVLALIRDGARRVPGGWMAAGHRALGRAVGLSRRGVIRALARLEAVGLVERRRRRRPDGGRAEGAYRLTPVATHVTVAGVVAIVARHAGLPQQAIRAGRFRPTDEARQLAMYLAAVDLGLSQRAIGDAFGRDRTTVRHALGRVEDRRDDTAFDATIAALRRSLSPNSVDWDRAIALRINERRLTNFRIARDLASWEECGDRAR